MTPGIAAHDKCKGVMTSAEVHIFDSFLYTSCFNLPREAKQSVRWLPKTSCPVLELRYTRGLKTLIRNYMVVEIGLLHDCFKFCSEYRPMDEAGSRRMVLSLICHLRNDCGHNILVLQPVSQHSVADHRRSLSCSPKHMHMHGRVLKFVQFMEC